MMKAIHDLYSRNERTIHDLYARDETFLDFFAHDLDDGAVWFNNSEFARFHDIDGEKVLSIFTGDTRSQTININLGDGTTAEGVSRNRGILYCRAQEFSDDWSAGGSLRVDGKLYTVAEARLIQDQVWRILLEANNG